MLAPPVQAKPLISQAIFKMWNDSVPDFNSAVLTFNGPFPSFCVPGLEACAVVSGLSPGPASPPGCSRLGWHICFEHPSAWSPPHRAAADMSGCGLLHVSSMCAQAANMPGSRAHSLCVQAANTPDSSHAHADDKHAWFYHVHAAFPSD